MARSAPRPALARPEPVSQASRGVAVREFVLKRPHGRVDYLLFVDGRAVGVVEAKKEGEPLIGVEWQSARYVNGLPDDAVDTEFARTSRGERPGHGQALLSGGNARAVRLVVRRALSSLARGLRCTRLRLRCSYRPRCRPGY